MKIKPVYREDTRGWINEYSNMLEEKIDSVERIGFSGPKTPILNTTLSTFWSLPREIKKEDADIIHYLSNNYLVSPKRLDLADNTIVTVHDLFPFYGNGLLEKTKRFFHDRNLENVDEIIAVSKFTKNDLIERVDINEEKITVIPSAVDLNHYSETEAKELELPENYLLYVGGDFERKNLPFLFELHSKLTEKFENLHLVLAGSISRETMEELSRNRNEESKIVFKDWVDEKNMPELYSRAEVYVQPSKREGQGIPPVEAMACGTPPVVSNRTALPETVGNQKMVSELEMKKFLDKISEIIQDRNLYQDLVDYGKERAKYFSKENAIERHRELYNRTSE